MAGSRGSQEHLGVSGARRQGRVAAPRPCGPELQCKPRLSPLERSPCWMGTGLSPCPGLVLTQSRYAASELRSRGWGCLLGCKDKRVLWAGARRGPRAGLLAKEAVPCRGPGPGCCWGFLVLGSYLGHLGGAGCPGPQWVVPEGLKDYPVMLVGAFGTRMKLGLAPCRAGAKQGPSSGPCLNVA